MSKRRGHGEGSIYQRADGRWVAALSVEGGRRVTRAAKTRAEAARKLDELKRRTAEGEPLAESRQTVAQFAADWLASYRAHVAASSWRKAEACLRIYVLPAVGRVRLVALTAQQVQAMMSGMAARGLAPKTIAAARALLRQILAEAMRFGLVQRNAAALTRAPRMDHHERIVLTREQAQALLAATSGDRLATLFVLALATGMRKGELLGLRWRDVDLKRGVLSVVQSLGEFKQMGRTKTLGSRRQIRFGEDVAQALRTHRAAQRQERLAIGPGWVEHDLVFADAAGGPLSPSWPNRLLWRYAARAGVPRLRFHDLRHTTATLLLSAGVPVKVVSEMLGHSSVAITANVYQHVLPDMQEQAAAALGKALFG